MKSKKPKPLSPYRKNVKASLIKGLLDLAFIRESETSLRKVANFIEYTVTLFDNHFTYFTRERSLRDGWLETRHAYTYQEVRGVIRRG